MMVKSMLNVIYDYVSMHALQKNTRSKRIMGRSCLSFRRIFCIRCCLKILMIFYIYDLF
jgi:hypothetical protein